MSFSLNFFLTPSDPRRILQYPPGFLVGPFAERFRFPEFGGDQRTAREDADDGHGEETARVDASWEEHQPTAVPQRCPPAQFKTSVIGGGGAVRSTIKNRSPSSVCVAKSLSPTSKSIAEVPMVADSVASVSGTAIR